MEPSEAGVLLGGLRPQQLKRLRVLALRLVQDDQLAVLAVRLKRTLRFLQTAVIETQQGRH